jgi:malate dehydrogenase (oxaloacetate-decarboxylating)
VTETVPQDAKTPQVLVGDEEIFDAQVGGKLSVELKAPLDTQRALSNPDPEIHPDVAAKHAAVEATGRSDFPNQINNVLAFPGVFRGALDVGARKITQQMMVAAAGAIFSVVGDDLAPDRIVPSPLDPRVCPAVAEAVAGASGV